LFQTEDKSDILRQLKEWLVRIPPPLASKVPSAASVQNIHHSILGSKLTYGALPTIPMTKGNNMSSGKIPSPDFILDL